MSKLGLTGGCCVAGCHERNTELMLDITLSVNGAPLGDYIVRYTIHDQNSNNTNCP
jgi:hypothetical protein